MTIFSSSLQTGCFSTPCSLWQEKTLSISSSHRQHGKWLIMKSVLTKLWEVSLKKETYLWLSHKVIRVAVCWWLWQPIFQLNGPHLLRCVLKRLHACTDSKVIAINYSVFADLYLESLLNLSGERGGLVAQPVEILRDGWQGRRSGRRCEAHR